MDLFFSSSFSRNSIIILFFFLCLSCSEQDNEIQRESLPESIREMLLIGESDGINRQEIDWEDANRLVKEAYVSFGFNRAVSEFLKILDDNHSFYVPGNGQNVIRHSTLNCQAKLPVLTNRLENVGYIAIPPFSGSPEEGIRYAQDLQHILEQQDQVDLKGWIIDLSQNTGGNMYPMLTALGPFFTRPVLGYFIDPEGGQIPWGYHDRGSYYGSSGNKIVELSKPYELLQNQPKVAILIDSRTASSGEAVLISFIGRDKTIIIGEPTCGLSTANQSYTLSNGSTLFLTISVMADASKEKYGARVMPDIRVSDLEEMNLELEKWFD